MQLNPGARRRTAGLSLVELMVGITVGLLVLVAVAALYLNSIAGSRTGSAANQLNQSLRAVTDIMVNDIRRAGHWSAPTAGQGNPFHQATTNLTLSSAATGRDCILYAYDATHAGGTPGVVDAGIDFEGFRLNDAGVLQALDPAAGTSSTQADCATLGWLDLTDARTIQITALSFSTAGSKCTAFRRTGAPDPSACQAWSTTSTQVPACRADAVRVDTTPTSCAYPSSPSTTTFVETRLVDITITGRSRLDPTIPPQTVRQAVLVRSNRILNP